MNSPNLKEKYKQDKNVSFNYEFLKMSHKINSEMDNFDRFTKINSGMKNDKKQIYKSQNKGFLSENDQSMSRDDKQSQISKKFQISRMINIKNRAINLISADKNVKQYYEQKQKDNHLSSVKKNVSSGKLFFRDYVQNEKSKQKIIDTKVNSPKRLKKEKDFTIFHFKEKEIDPLEFRSLKRSSYKKLHEHKPNYTKQYKDTKDKKYLINLKNKLNEYSPILSDKNELSINNINNSEPSLEFQVINDNPNQSSQKDQLLKRISVNYQEKSNQNIINKSEIEKNTKRIIDYIHPDYLKVGNVNFDLLKTEYQGSVFKIETNLVFPITHRKYETSDSIYN